ncbi:MAG: bifunctional folylpolyglutamate synthase/dihydrofolate synthase [Bacteroidetes bacterium]|nr:bifunctional folylpolyglutamate synthase/dihydrofolate synthase [Bacteroidota bacterium]
MTYPETLQYLFSRLPMFQRIGAAAYKADLENTLKLSEILGKPEGRFRSIHVAGTNGKGSTSHFLASILQEAGFKTGLFTSPHLRDFRERIRINGKVIPKMEVRTFVESYREAFDKVQPSFFEWSFALASHYFALQNVDIAVMETGMGGRLDSTNIITPVLSVITNIGLDHVQFLGPTIPEIAKEKAGIIKKEIPVVIGETQAETTNIFMDFARSRNAPIIFADRNFSVKSYGYSKKPVPKLWLDISSGIPPSSARYYPGLYGSYQCRNLVTVLQSVETLRQSGIEIRPEHIKQGISKVTGNTGIQGRWQLLSKQPLTFADIGHNADGIREVVGQINRIEYRKLHFVLGVVNDKDVGAMLKLLPTNASYYFCKANIPRGLDSGSLLKMAHLEGLEGNEYSSVKEALYAARQAAALSDLIVVGGSAFVVAEVL